MNYNYYGQQPQNLGYNQFSQQHNNLYQNQNQMQYNGNYGVKINKFELIPINNIEEVKNHIMNANQRVFFLDNNSNKLIEKRCDNQGIYELKYYELKEINQNTNSQFVSKNELQDFENKINGKFDELVNLIKGGANNNEQQS